MKCKLVLGTLFFLSAYFPYAQTGKFMFSAKEAVEYALSHHPLVLIQEKDVRQSHLKTQEFTGIGLPQLHAGVSVQHFVKLPVNVLPNFVAPAVYGGLVSAGVAPYDPQKMSPDGYDPIEARFGQKYQASASFTASQLVFSSDYFIGLKASRNYEQLSKLSHRQQIQQTKYQVLKSCLEHLINSRRMELLEVQCRRVDQLCKEMQIIHAQGLAEKLDVQRIELVRDQWFTEKEKLSHLIRVSLYNLKLHMGFPMSDTLVITDTLSEEVLFQENPGSSESFQKRYDYQILNKALYLQSLNRKRHLMGHIPSLAAFASGGYTAFNNDHFDFLSRGVKWFPNFVIGASLSWTLFDGLQHVRRFQQVRLEEEKMKEQMKMIERGSVMEQFLWKTQWENARKTLVIRKKNMELASEVLRVTEKKYHTGVGSFLEILQALSAQKEARIQYLETLYELKMAQLELQKSTGEL